ncbi:MAG: DUF4956 domain-containing protein [Clostridia bacterium]|nr:DUF4956 domain-containing protein [Clostridia bacterium]
MNETLFHVETANLTLKNILIIFGCTIICSLLISLVYMFTRRKTGYRPAIVVTLLLLAPISSILMLVIGNNTARALSVGGGIALIRYRSNFSDPKDLAFVFLTMAVGVASGTGLVGIALVSTVLVCLLALVIHFTGIGTKNSSAMQLRITIPEDMNHHGAFDDVFAKYCKGYTLESIKTTDFGTLLELRYIINMKNISEQKSFIDELRTRNGNLTVMLTRKNYEG